MASVKWSGLVSEMKGVLNGSILSVGYGGQTIRNRISGGGRKTSAWALVKMRLAKVAGTWRSLSSANQAAWASAAPSYPYTDKFGNSQTPSGYQLYCTLNSNLTLTSQTNLTTPLAPEPPENIGTPAVSNPSSGNLSLAFTPNAGNRSVICVQMSPVMSPGVTSIPRTMRQISQFNANATSPQSLNTDYTRVFPNIPTAGRVFWKVFQIQKTTGQRYGFITGYIDLA